MIYIFLNEAKKALHLHKSVHVLFVLWSKILIRFRNELQKYILATTLLTHGIGNFPISIIKNRNDGPFGNLCKKIYNSIWLLKCHLQSLKFIRNTCEIGFFFFLKFCTSDYKHFLFINYFQMNWFLKKNTFLLSEWN